MTPSNDYTQLLQKLMKERGISSFRQLSLRSQVSQRQLQQLRQGHILQMRLEVVLKLSQALHVSLDELLEQFSSRPSPVPSPSSEEHSRKVELQYQSRQAIDLETLQEEHSRKVELQYQSRQAIDLETLQQEYRRLQQQLEKQRETLTEEFQRSSLQVIESWLKYWPTAAVKAKENPDLSATKLLPLVKPLDQLLQQWEVEIIAPVGEELNYDPQWHTLVEGTARPGERVCVRYAGYRHRGRLLFRATATPVS
ncbi:MAG: helix-turn-helix domain-containing protein [Cyanobacteriota bacterium]|nr:helix-turn-helix domain-containing protein [Cyanobacteriota bacterium]